MLKKIAYVLPLFLFGLFNASAAKAICPVCAVAVGAGVGLTRYLGIDDTVSGIWIGGFMVALIMWTNNWLDKKNIRFTGRDLVSALIWVGLTYAPLYMIGIIGHPFNRLWGMDKMLLGSALGGASFYIFGRLYYYLKAKNNGHAHFPFEKVVLTIAPLIVFSIFFYFLTK